MLTLLSIVYLSLPYFFFAWGWLRWPVAALLSAILLAAIALSYKHLRVDRERLPDTPRYHKYDVLLFLLMAFVSLLPCGVGGIGFQRGDWLKHNAVLHDLSTQSWPAVCQFAEDGSPQYYLTYYIAYYLPPAAVGRLLGLTAAHLALFVWTLLGVILCGFWVARLVNARLSIAWPAWLLLGGMDVLGMLMVGELVEWWMGYWQYASNMAMLVWVPQHFLPGWIATAIIVDETERRRDLSLVAFVAALTALWSPFVTIGLAPVAALIAFRMPWRSALSFVNLVAGPAVLLVSGLYLATIESQKVPQGFIFEMLPWPKAIGFWILFCLVEFAVYAALLAPDVLRRENRNQPLSWNASWFLLSVGTLWVLPAYVLGKFNDLAMRASIPALFLFWIVLLRSFFGEGLKLHLWRRRLLLFCLVLGAVYPVKQWVAQVYFTRPGLHYYRDKLHSSVADFPEEYLHQYFGRDDAFFFRYLAPSPLQTAAESTSESTARP